MNALPTFRDRAGRTSADPLTLTGPVPVVDLEALALMLAPPAVLGEFVPRSPWKGLDRLPAKPPRPAADRPLAVVFGRAVETLTADADTIGVMVSGGLDSLAVLVHVLRIAKGRPVVAITVDLCDDTGASSAATVRRLLTELDLPVHLVVLDPARHRGEPVWSAAGPRLDALPEVNAAAAEIADDLGVQVLLSGDGADETLGVPRYATAQVAARHGARAAARYVADVARSGPGLAGEAAAVAACLAPWTFGAQAYWALNWPAWCDPVAPAVLAEPYRQASTAWAREWVQRRVAAHAQTRCSWAQADAYDAVFPHEAIPPAGAVPESSPFLHETVLATSLAMPVADRYYPRLPSAYLRCKAQVVGLLPAPMRRVLPRRKQYFATALKHQSATGRTAPTCVRAGLLDPVALADETDPAVLMVIAALERWLRTACDLTATTPDPP